MNYILFDWAEPKDGKKSFIGENIHCQLEEVYSYWTSRRIVGWVKGVRKVMRLSRRDDTIVCWLDFQAVLLYWFCLLTFRRRRIGCINVMLKDKTTMKNKAVARLYHIAFRSKRFLASVTSPDYGEYLKQRLGFGRELLLIHDVYRDEYKLSGGGKPSSRTVFCGGSNGRDWQFVIDVAKASPDVEFHVVMPWAVYQVYQQAFPTNVVAKHDIPMEEFMQEMQLCELVALPLNTQAPAGLIVMFQAAANGKYVITTDTLVTREYLSERRGSLLPKDVNLWVKTIQERLQDPEGNHEATAKLQAFLRTKCSERTFVDGVERMIEKLNNIKG